LGLGKYGSEYVRDMHREDFECGLTLSHYDFGLGHIPQGNV